MWLFCYLKKFISFFILFPLQVFTHIRSVYKEWNEDRIGKLVNEVLSVEPDRRCPQLHCSQIICTHGYIARLVWYLNNAKYSIDLVMYTLNSYDISAALNAASRRGVRVRIVTENTWSPIIVELASPVRRLPPPRNRYVHNKFCIIDGYQSLRELLPEGAKKPLTLCLTGSLNWITYGENCENVLITSAPRICKPLEQEFDYIWNKCVEAIPYK